MLASSSRARDTAEPDGQASVLPSHPAGNINPWVFSRAVNGDLRAQKRRIRESADGHRNHVGQVRKLPVQRRAATRTEVIGDSLAAVADPYVRTGRASDPHVVPGISSLNSKGASRPPLASQTMTNRNANGISLNNKRKLSATTACFVVSHTLFAGSSRQRLDIQIRHLQRVLLDEFAARLNRIAHQRGENVVGGHRILDAHLHESARFGVDGRVPQLFCVHLA
jgi:hypothetical protein